MDPEEIERLVNQLKLAPDKEKDCFILPADLAKLGQTRLGSSLVAKVFSSKAVNREAFRTQMPKILQASKHIEVEVVGENFFLLDFKSLADRRRALQEGPWNFFKDLVIFKAPMGLQKPSEIPFDDITVWVQLHNLPLAFMHSEIIRTIGGRLGIVLEVDTDEGGQCMGKFARIRIIRKLSLPLQKGIWVSLENDSDNICILLLYERLPNFCFTCGRIGHLAKDCEDTEANIEVFEFGVWMRAPVPSSGKKSSSNQANEKSEKTTSSSQATSKPTKVNLRSVTDEEIQEVSKPPNRIVATLDNGGIGFKEIDSTDISTMEIVSTKPNEYAKLKLPECLLLTGSESGMGTLDMIVLQGQVNKPNWKRLARGKNKAKNLNNTITGNKHPLEASIEDPAYSNVGRKIARRMNHTQDPTAVAASQPRRSP